MNTHSLSNKPIEPVPPDNNQRQSKVARPDTDEALPHIGLVGDTYTVLLSGEDTDGRYCLIDMHIPPGGGPPPHRHDFEETFIIKSGEIEATLRGVSVAGRTTPPPKLDKAAQADSIQKAKTLAPKYRTELLGP